MGSSKVKVIKPGEVKVLHQLNSDGTPYAEDVTIKSSVPGRLAYLESQDGKIGVFLFSFSASSPEPEGLLFAEEVE
jgi:hypothetical protein